METANCTFYIFYLKKSNVWEKIIHFTWIFFLLTIKLLLFKEEETEKFSDSLKITHYTRDIFYTSIGLRAFGH